MAGFARAAADSVPFATTVAAVAALSFLAGGYILSKSSPVAILSVLMAAAWVWFLRPSPRPPVLYLAALAVFGLFVVWSGLSVLWSIGPDLSWQAFNLAALYLVVAVVVGLTPARRPHVRLVGYGYLVVVVAVSIAAYLGKVLPDVVTHAQQQARLASPVGYWNVLALLLALALPVALAAAGDRSNGIPWRVAAAGAAVPVALAFFFTFSRGGWLALLVCLVVYFVLSPSRLASLASLAAISVPVAFALWRVRGLESLFAATTDAALRSSQGQTLLFWSGVALAATMTAQGLIAVVQRAVRWPRRVKAAAGATLLVILVVGSAGAAWRYADARGGAEWIRERLQSFAADADTTSSANRASRLTSLNTYRLPLWREALEQSEVMRTAGSGAGTFVLTHYRFRTSVDVVRHAHSQWLNVLSELGVVGLGLFAAALCLFVAAAVGNPFRGRGDGMRPLLAALQAGVVAFAAHISVDWDWEMAAAGTVFFLFAGTCASYLAVRHVEPDADGFPSRPRERVGGGDVEAGAVAAGPAGEDRRRPAAASAWPLRLAGCLVLLLLAVSWALPYLSDRAQDAAFTASAVGDTAGALERARRAARFNPLAVDPMILEAQVLQQLGRNREALDVLARAARLQPDNYEVYEAQATLYLQAFHRKEDAVAALMRALALNPLDPKLQSELARARGG